MRYVWGVSKLSAVSTTKYQESEGRELDRVEKSERKEVSGVKQKTVMVKVTPCHSGAVCRLWHLANIWKLFQSMLCHPCLKFCTPQFLTMFIYTHCLHEAYSVHAYVCLVLCWKYAFHIKLTKKFNFGNWQMYWQTDCLHMHPWGKTYKPPPALLKKTSHSHTNISLSFQLLQL